MLLKDAARKRSSLIIMIPLALSAFTHLWNPAGFPDVFYDEGAYMRRAMDILYYQIPQESQYYYDHPFFGQILLAGIFAIAGYPESLSSSATTQSIESLYLVPRVLMGLLAVLDTFLVHKIVQHRYGNSRIALFASILFAVMPLGWLTRRILLDSLLLPFLLSSILFAIRLKHAEDNRYALLALSGICLGLAIFTKVPAFVAIPLVGFLVYSGFKKNKLKNLGLWLIPVILVPMMWPAYSVFTGQFEHWVSSLAMQTQRESSGISAIFWNFWIDPVLLVLGMSGLVYMAVVKRDFFPLLWAGPFLVFFTFIGYVQNFHILPVLPVLCISAALLVDDAIGKIRHVRLSALSKYGAMASIGIFGLISTTLLITTDMTSSQFEAAAFVLSISDSETTIVSNPAYSWMYTFVFKMPYALDDYREVLYSPPPTNKIVLLSEPHFQANIREGKELRQLYNGTKSIMTFQGDVGYYDINSYPYASMSSTNQGDFLDVRYGVLP